MRLRRWKFGFSSNIVSGKSIIMEGSSKEKRKIQQVS
jgi:hypothetical protein